MRSPPPKGKKLLIGSEDIEIYPQYCGDGHKCIQCFFNGKYLCSPRFWLYPILDGYPGYPPVTGYRVKHHTSSLSSVSRYDETLENRMAGQPLVEMPDGGFVAEATDRVMNRPVSRRKEPYRLTDACCERCGYSFLTQRDKEQPRDNYRRIYRCPQCGRGQIMENKLLHYRIPDTVKLLLRELRGQDFSIRVTIERIQQKLGVKLSVYAYYLLLREMGLPLTRKFERGGTVTEEQREASKRNILKTPSHRVKAYR